jgi:hypothetical protein
MKQIIPFLAVIAILIIVAIVISTLFNYRLKKQIMQNGTVNDNVLRLMNKLSGGSDFLKWGLILLFGGIGLIVLEYLPFHADESPLPYGVEAIFLAAGFLAYYGLVRKNHPDK